MCQLIKQRKRANKAANEAWLCSTNTVQGGKAPNTVRGEKANTMGVGAAGAYPTADRISVVLRP
jgi:hypothetical protein